MLFAPIALFAFNRPTLLERTLTALAANNCADRSPLTIFCDGPRNEKDECLTKAVYDIAKKAKGFASLEVVGRTQNMGCAASVIDGLTQMFSVHERLVVMEDDIITSPYTLNFLNEALERYADFKTVFNIAAWSPPTIAHTLPPNYPYDVYAIPRFNCWGWASWRDRFINIDWSVADQDIFFASDSLQEAFNIGGEDLSPMLHAQLIEKKINSWAIRADYARFKHGGVGINPIRSFTLNIGMASGTHTKEATTYYDSDIDLAIGQPRFMTHIFVNKSICKAYHQFYSGQKRSLPIRAINKLSRLVFGRNIIP